MPTDFGEGGQARIRDQHDTLTAATGLNANVPPFPPESAKERKNANPERALPTRTSPSPNPEGSRTSFGECRRTMSTVRQRRGHVTRVEIT